MSDRTTKSRRSADMGNLRIETTIDTVDLTKSWSNGDDSLWSHISKNTMDGSSPPSLNDGVMFSNNTSLYLFGGAVSAAPGPHPLPPPNSLWEYGINTNRWKRASPNGDSVQRIILGAVTQSSTGQAYYLGGAIVPKSDAAFLLLPNPQGYLVQGLLEFDTATVEFSNKSSTGVTGDGTIARGFITLIESLGDGGVLIAFGGVVNTPGQAMYSTDPSFQDTLFQVCNHAPLDIRG